MLHDITSLLLKRMPSGRTRSSNNVIIHISTRCLTAENNVKIVDLTQLWHSGVDAGWESGSKSNGGQRDDGDRLA